MCARAGSSLPGLGLTHRQPPNAAARAGSSLPGLGLTRRQPPNAAAPLPLPPPPCLPGACRASSLHTLINVKTNLLAQINAQEDPMLRVSQRPPPPTHPSWGCRRVRPHPIASPHAAG